MKPKALVVEDDQGIIESIEDTLFSIGHKHDWATNQQDARRLLKHGEYDYVLLDVEIPAKPHRGCADKEYGCNLLKDIQRIKGPRRVPVVVMSDRRNCLDLTGELYANGASEFVAKPFVKRGRTLASVIRKVLDNHVPRTPHTRSGAQPSAARQFAGGELTCHADHVDLLGVTIISDRGTGQCMAVLKQLRRKDNHGRFVRMSGEELAAVIHARGGVGTITGCIQTLRRNIVDRLGKTGVVVGRQDVIEHDQQGYGLRDWIEIRDGDTAACPPDVPADVPANVPANGQNVPANVPAGTELNPRQQWILEQLERGVPLQRVMVEKEFGVGDKTAKRDLSGLVQRGLIVYLRQGREGRYRLGDSGYVSA